MPGVAAVTGHANPGFVPTLNRRDVCNRVGRLTEAQLDVLAWIEEPDEKLAKIAGVDPRYLSNFFDRIYTKLGINASMVPSKKRAVMVIMYRMFDSDRWTPSTDERELLIRALAPPEERALESKDLEHEPEPEPEVVAESAPVVEEAPAPVNGHDVGEVSSIEVAAPTEIIHEEPSQPEPDEDEMDEPIAQVTELHVSDARLERIADLMESMVNEGRVSERRIQILDALAKDLDYEKAAHLVGTDAGTIAATVSALKTLFGVPNGKAKKSREAAAQGRAALLAAWRLYSDRLADPEETSPGPELDASAPLAPQEPEPAPVPAPDPVTETRSEVSAEPEPIAAPASEPVVPSAPAPQEPAPEPEPAPVPDECYKWPPMATVPGYRAGGVALSEPHRIVDVKVLYSFEPDVGNKQLTLYRLGYRVEHVETHVTFDPKPGAICAMVMVKRG